MECDRPDEADESMQYVRDWKWIRILGPKYDSGWLPTGNQLHEAAKHHVQKWCNGAQDHYFIAKRDYGRADWRSSSTAVPLAGKDAPVPIWHRQKPWNADFKLPADLWSGAH